MKADESLGDELDDSEKRRGDKWVKLSTVRRFAAIAVMWRTPGTTIQTIADSFFTNTNTASAWVQRARSLLGEDLVPHREGGSKIGSQRTASLLDSLSEPGDTVTGTKEELGSRPNVYQNAQTRGWAVGVRDKGLHWEVTALQRVPILAFVRAAKRRSAKQQLG